MILTLHLSSEEEARLVAFAKKEEMDVETLALRLVTQRLPSAPHANNEDPTLALLDSWDREDAEMTPEEIEEARSDFERFKRAINDERERSGSRIIYP